MNSEHTMTCPEHLSESARAEWNRMVSTEEIAPADAAALAAYCAAYGRWVDAESNIQKFGVVIKNKGGNPIQNPYVAVAHQALDTMHKFLALLQHKQTDNKGKVF